MIKRAPYIHAYMPYDHTDFDASCYRFSGLMDRLKKISCYTTGYKVLTSQEETQTGEGLDPVNDIDKVISFWREHNYHQPDGITPMHVAGEKWSEGRIVSKINYWWGGEKGANFNYFSYEKWGGLIESEGVSCQLFSRICETIINWNRPSYLWCGDYNYWVKSKGVFHPERTIANWFCWIPQQVESSLLPSAAIIQPMLDGTLICTSIDYFNIDNEKAVYRANDIEIEMNEAGILPHLEYLRNR